MMKHKRNGFDALGTIATAYAGSVMASKNPTLRYTVDGSDRFFMDWRFIGGAAAAVAAATDKGTVGRVGHDVAVGAFSSLASTEAVRAAAAKHAEQHGTAPQQIPAGAGAAAASPMGGYVPGWVG